MREAEHAGSRSDHESEKPQVGVFRADTNLSERLFLETTGALLGIAPHQRDYDMELASRCLPLRCGPVAGAELASRWSSLYYLLVHPRNAFVRPRLTCRASLSPARQPPQKRRCIEIVKAAAFLRGTICPPKCAGGSARPIPRYLGLEPSTSCTTSCSWGSGHDPGKYRHTLRPVQRILDRPQFLMAHVLRHAFRPSWQPVCLLSRANRLMWHTWCCSVPETSCHAATRSIEMHISG